MDTTRDETLEEKAQRILTEEVPEITTKPAEGEGLDPQPKRWRMEKSLIEIDLPSITFSGKNDPQTGEPLRAGIWIDGIDIGPVLQGVQFNADIHGVNSVVLHLIGLPAKIRALGVVEIESKGADSVADEFMARYEESERRRAAEEAQQELDKVIGEQPSGFPPDA